MVNQTMKTNVANLFSDNATLTDSNIKSSQSNGTSFSNYMNQSLSSSFKNNQISSSSRNIDLNERNQTSSSNNKDKNQVESSKVDSSSPKDSLSNSVKKQSEKSNINKTDDTYKTNNESSDYDNKLEEKGKLLEDEIKNTVKDILDISEEELEEIMSQLGLGYLELLNIDNLKLLTLTANNETDVTALLMNEDMGNQLNDLLQSIGNLNVEENFDLTPEQLQQLLDKAKNQLNSVDDTVDQMNTKDDVDTENILNDANEMLDDSIDSQAKDITIEVSKETSDEQLQNTSIEESTTVSDANQASNKEEHQDQKNQQNQQMTSNDNLNHFVDNLLNGVTQTNSFTEQASKVTQMRDIVTQIVEQIKINIKADTTSMELMLNPENLGRVNLSVSDKNGVMTAQFIVENQAAREAIESQLHILRESLEAQGLKIEAVEVTVSNFGFDQSNQAGSESNSKKGYGKRKITLDDLKALEEDNVEQETVERPLADGSSVDYIA